MFTKAVKIETVITIHEAPRMAMRIQKHTDAYGCEYFKVQYQYSKTNDIWKNYAYFDYKKGSRPYENNGFHSTLSAAMADAKRRHKANN